MKPLWLMWTASAVLSGTPATAPDTQPEDPRVERLLRDTLATMRRGLFLLEGGSEFFTVFEGQSFRLGARLANYNASAVNGSVVRLSERSVPTGVTYSVSVSVSLRFLMRTSTSRILMRNMAPSRAAAPPKTACSTWRKLRPRYSSGSVASSLWASYHSRNRGIQGIRSGKRPSRIAKIRSRLVTVIFQSAV